MSPVATSLIYSREIREAWYPPGHGDVYRCLFKSGLLNHFLHEGRTWAFISNIDNLGATVETREVDAI
ncbi:unnamed protein product [Protopolystoma xenopodis]|uniref:UTP--glucose-1-phosphate uridylyltransferase n=1 Tax=Protopolystoma xenopodis TaxID=117903 RepID=A0A3S5CJ79_9PLAT|nr:unnamed protein product [Protopolystoma xenopodis]